MVVRWLGGQVKVKSKEFPELDIEWRELVLFYASTNPVIASVLILIPIVYSFTLSLLTC